MSAVQPPPPKAPLAALIAVFLGFFALATMIHVAAGAFESGFGGFEDEPAHLVTALMIRDWVASGEWLRDPGAAREYAETYYVHYPKVGIGQWPPVFHLALGMWMLVVGTSTAAVVTFLTLVATVTAFAVYGVVRRPLGEAAGIAAGVLFLCVPIVQQCSASAMTEMMLALLSLLAVLAFGRYMDTGRARWVLAFAALSAATILTKGSGLALALVPPLALLLGRRFDLLRRPSLWLAGLLVGLLAGPWYWLTLETNQGTWAGGHAPSVAYVAYAGSEYAAWLPRLTGVLGLAAVPVGMVWGHRKGALQGRWHALLAWVPSLALLHLLVPSSAEERHLAVLAPAWTIFASLGAGVVATAVLGSRLPRAAPALGVLALCAALLATGERVRTKHWAGWGNAAGNLVTRGEDLPPRFLVASDPVGEGLFVAGVAFSEAERPGHVVLRGSKVLCRADWSGRDYEPIFADPSGVDRHLADLGVGVIVIDESVRGTRHWYTHMDQLVALVGAPGSPWVPLDRWDLIRGGDSRPGALRAWRRADPGGLEPRPLTFQEVRGIGVQR